MEAGKRTIREIFNRGRNLEIPFFQRSYVWDEPQWKRFLEDMTMVSETRSPYFLGSVILKQQESTSDKDSLLTIIDGQQRLTTLNIFLKVLCLYNDDDAGFTETFKKQRDKKIILLHNHNNEESFNKVMYLTELTTFENISENDQILKAYEYFKKNIIEEELSDKLNFFDILDNILFVGIDLNLQENEQQIFDTINSLGVRLTTAELLKNYFFNRDETEKYKEYWKNIFEKDDDTYLYWDREVVTGRIRRSVLDLFFYSYLQIKIQEDGLKVKTPDKIYFSRVENLFESYKRFIKDYNLDKDVILKEIREYALLFINNFNPEITRAELTAESGIERINAIIFGLDNSTLMPYVLYILKNVSDKDQRKDLFNFLESYLLRRLVVKATPKNYNQLFTDRLISNKILSKEEFKELITQSDNKINFFPDNEQLKNGFDTSQLVNSQSAGILYMIESKIRKTGLHSTILKGMKEYSLEHLMPKKWSNKWNSVDSTEKENFRNFKLYTLGNLAIITQSLNASIRDSDWATKKVGQGSNQGLEHYSAGIETLSKYLKLEEWNEDEMQKRADFLYEEAIKIWQAI